MKVLNAFKTVQLPRRIAGVLVFFLMGGERRETAKTSQNFSDIVMENITMFSKKSHSFYHVILYVEVFLCKCH